MNRNQLTRHQSIISVFSLDNTLYWVYW